MNSTSPWRAGGRAVVEREVLKFRRGQFGQPWHFVDFSRGRGTAITNEAAYGQQDAMQQRAEHVLDDPSVLAIKGLGQFKEFRVVSEFRALIESWHISDGSSCIAGCCVCGHATKAATRAPSSAFPLLRAL